MRVPLDRLLVETDAPYLTPQAVRKERNQPAYVVHTARFIAEHRGIAYAELEAAVEAQRRPAVRLVSRAHAAEPAPPARVRRPPEPRPRPELPHRLEPPRRDRARRPSSAADDVVLEVGGGLGVLSEHLAARAAPRPRRRDRPRASSPRCATRSTRSTTSRCTSPTRSSSTTRRSTRAPTKVVANLPYGVAATVILDTVVELPAVTRWVAMVQKEVGERLAAAARHAGLRRARRCSPSCRCDVQVRAAGVANGVPPRAQRRLRARRASTRTAPPAPADVRALVSAGFAHRRKALPRSLVARGRRRTATRARAALDGARPARRRPRRALAPAQWRALAEALR